MKLKNVLSAIKKEFSYGPTFPITIGIIFLAMFIFIAKDSLKNPNCNCPENLSFVSIRTIEGMDLGVTYYGVTSIDTLGLNHYRIHCCAHNSDCREYTSTIVGEIAYMGPDN